MAFYEQAQEPRKKARGDGEKQADVLLVRGMKPNDPEEETMKRQQAKVEGSSGQSKGKEWG